MFAEGVFIVSCAAALIALLNMVDALVRMAMKK
jgi:hypothetical protein